MMAKVKRWIKAYVNAVFETSTTNRAMYDAYVITALIVACVLPRYGLWGVVVSALASIPAMCCAWVSIKRRRHCGHQGSCNQARR